MFFIKAGKLLAYIGFWLSILRIGLGLLIAFGTPDLANNVAASRHILGTQNSGEAITEATLVLLVSICLGILAEIGFRVVQLSESK